MTNIHNLDDFRPRGAMDMQTPLKRILHADDDEDIRTIVEMSLELAGHYELLSCSGADEALAQAAAFRPQLFLLDVMMPDMSGPQLYEALRTQDSLKSVPAVFVTAKAERDFARDLVDAGALAVITKPFDPMQLATEIEDIWSNAANRAQA